MAPFHACRLGNIALLDGSSKVMASTIGRYHRQQFGHREYQSIFFENDAIRVDMGKGADNLHVAMERVVVGGSNAVIVPTAHFPTHL
jgi:hypothetical protein